MATTNNNATREQWATYREDALVRGETILMVPKIDRWYPFMGAQGATNENKGIKDIWEGQLRRDSPFAAWEKLEGNSSFQGIIVPMEALDGMDIHVLRQAAGALEFRRKNLGYYDFLRSVSDKCTQAPELPAALVGLWHYVLAYARLLRRARTQGAEVGTLVQSLVAQDSFGSFLPSGQCISLLLQYAHRDFARLWDGAEYRRLLARSHPSVRSFFEGIPDLGEVLSGRNTTAAEAAFYDCCRADIPYITVQEVLDDASGKRLLQKLPRTFRERFENLAGLGLKDRFQRFVGQFSILDRVRTGTSIAPATAQNYGVPFPSLASDGASKWHDIHSEDLTALLQEVEGRPSVLQVGEARWWGHLAHTIGYLTAPVLSWPGQDKQSTPHWSEASPELIAIALREHEQEQALVEKELERITRLTPKLKQATTLAAIRELERKRSPFATAAARGRWRQMLDRQRQEVLSQQRFRDQKKIEFGFTEAGFSSSDEHYWLDELLKVEKEVRPYMAYVRKAFQAALPVGSTIEFNPYRHRHDGVEFDPDTVQDQDKWLRGDVMKTLRSRRNYAPITQVNVFCLDFSRSMNHDLMRNLFKVVFLLVSGLEGRDTYDAIHFFGSGFREAVSFTDAQGFTSRAVLAKILSHVATIETGSVVYSGFGGTNISAAVEESHFRIQAFSKQLDEERPDIRFVKSILILTDGQPTVGIINIPKLKEFVDGFRDEGEVSIKGIYLKHPDDRSDFISQIFGPLHAVEASSFEELIASFVQTMSLTYRQQRKEYRAAQKRKRLLGERLDQD